MNKPLDLVGIGIGPFNLSLAALLEKAPQARTLFFDKKERFEWHSEILFADSTMQTSYLKDLVTPVDPTSPYSFLNYLCANGHFYHFLNTQRTTISRREFELYCTWVSRKLEHRLRFGTEVFGVQFKEGQFVTETDKGFVSSRNICVATGMVPRVPECAQNYIGAQVFHAKSPLLKSMDLSSKRVAIVGGGQTGVEIFRNILNGKWGRVESVNLFTSRQNLEPLDESAFTNEYFTPGYVNEFWNIDGAKKDKIVDSQKLASDGNTPSYLLDLYRDLYRLRYVEGDRRTVQILPNRELTEMHRATVGHTLVFENTFTQQREAVTADVVILATGFSNSLPRLLEPLLPLIKTDTKGRLCFRKNYSVEWQGPEENKIYALNFSRHNHGIMDPQTSLMAWRSASVVNDLANAKIYETESEPNFTSICHVAHESDVYTELQ